MLNVIRSGISAANQEIAVISNNIANVGTDGYKRSHALFEDVYAANMPDATGDAAGLGAQPLMARRSHAQGSIETSVQVLDMAVLGPGMLVLEPREGETNPAYTRNGAGRIDATGRIVNAEGRAFLDPAGRPVTVPSALDLGEGRRSLLTSLAIGTDGAVRAIYGDSGEQMLGTLALARFTNEPGLQAQGNAIFVETGLSGPARVARPGTPGFGTLRSGALEMSNTDLTAELVALIRAQQTFASNAKALQTSVDMDKRMIG